MQAKQNNPEWLATLQKHVSVLDKENLLYTKAAYVCNKAADILKNHNDNVRKMEELSQSDLYNLYFKRAKMYLQHFFVSFAMMIERGEIPVSYYSYYGVDADILQKLDNITDVELEDLCQKVFVGENERIRKTETQRVFNPSSIQLEAHYDVFHNYFEMLQILRERCRISQFALDSICAEAKNLSLKLSE